MAELAMDAKKSENLETGDAKSPTDSSLEDLFELGELYFDKGDYEAALKKLSGLCRICRLPDDSKIFLKSIKLRLRMHAERDEQEEIDEIKNEIQELALKTKIELSSEVYYVLGLCFGYRSSYQKSLEFCEKAVAISLEKNDLESLCHGLTGIAIAQFRLGDIEASIIAVEKVKEILKQVHSPNVELSIHVFYGNLLRSLERFEEAIEVYWECYNLTRKRRSTYIELRLLFSMGLTYFDLGKTELGHTFLKLASDSADPKNMKDFKDRVAEKLNELKCPGEAERDLIFNRTSRVIIEKDKGRIELKNQFVLVELLYLFISNPGLVFSKSELAQRIWSERYNPLIHDNKIYVTIGRLRQLIEPNLKRPKYIFRAPGGYFFNETIQFEITNEAEVLNA